LRTKKIEYKNYLVTLLFVFRWIVWWWRQEEWKRISSNVWHQPS